MLHERVGREGKPLLPATGSVELDEVTGNVLELRLCTLFHAFPLTCTEM